MNELGATRIWFDFLTQPEDEVVDRAGYGGRFVPPDQMEGLIPRHNLSLPLGQVPQDFEFLVRQNQGLPPLERAQPTKIDDRLSNAELAEPCRRASQHGVNAGEEFFKGK